MIFVGNYSVLSPRKRHVNSIQFIHTPLNQPSARKRKRILRPKSPLVQKLANHSYWNHNVTALGFPSLTIFNPPTQKKKKLLYYFSSTKIKKTLQKSHLPVPKPQTEPHSGALPFNRSMAPRTASSNSARSTTQPSSSSSPPEPQALPWGPSRWWFFRKTREEQKS